MLKFIFCLTFCLSGTALFAQSVQDTVSNITQFEYAYPFWSPDATEIVFQSNLTGNWQLYKLNVATKEVKRLTENKFNDVTPSWSPDGSRILFASDRDGDDEIFVLDINSNEVRQLTHNSSRDIHPNWSPDSKKIIFTADRTEDTKKKLFIKTMNENGGDSKVLKEDEYTNSYASYSPDGKHIAFLKWMDKGKNGEIFCMKSDGTNEVRLTTNNVWDGWPAWSAKGDQVIYSSPVDDKFKLWAVDISTKTARQLTFGDEDDARANCCTNTESIVFNRGKSGKIDILILHPKP